MLPSLFDQVLLVLAPTHFSLVRVRGLFGKRKLIAQYSQMINLVDDHQAQWNRAIEALEFCLKDRVWQNARFKITIASSMVRYFLLPWNDTILSRVEQQRMARFRMEEVFGSSTANYRISLAEHSYGQPQLACAVDSDLLSKLQQLAQINNLRIKTIQPHFIAGFNFWRKELKAKQAYFLMVQEGKLFASRISNGNLQSLKVEQIPNGELTDEKLSMFLRREHLINEINDEAAHVYIHTTKKDGLLMQSLQFQLSHLNFPVDFLNYPAAFLAKPVH